MSAAYRPPLIADPVLRDPVGRVARFWSVLFVVGAFWIVVSLVILKFTHASATTVGILTGITFLIASAQGFMLAILHPPLAMVVAAVRGPPVGGRHPGVDPPAQHVRGVRRHPRVHVPRGRGVLDCQAFAERPVTELWSLTLIAGILAVILAFWTEGEFFLEKAASPLLVFAGIWALMHGITDIIRAFQIRRTPPIKREPLTSY